MPKKPKDIKVEVLRAALVEGERSGASTPFDFDEFIERKRQGKKGSLSRSRLDTGSKPRY